MTSIPKAAFGFDLDSLLAYQTAKLVKINDRRLGCLYYTLVLCVVFWVIGFQIFYSNEHFQLFDVKGTGRMSIQLPTKNLCNPRDDDCDNELAPATQLPYCEEYRGRPTHPSVSQRKCRYFDESELLPQGMLHEDMLIPTRIDFMEERRLCVPSEENGFNCKRLWGFEEAHEKTYVADIESYTVMILSTYFRKEVQGTSLQHQGFYYECRDPTTHKVLKTDPCEGILSTVPIRCMPGHDCGIRGHARQPPTLKFIQEPKPDARRSRKGDCGGRGQAFLSRDGSADCSTPGVELIGAEEVVEKDPRETGAFATPYGDIFTVKKLLELGGLELDGSFMNNQSLRERGTMLVVQVEYANLRPFVSTLGDLEVGYIYKVVERTLDQMKVERYASAQPDSFPGKRSRENVHGIKLNVYVVGSFGTFNVIYLLVMLTTSLALLVSAGKAVDMFASYWPTSFQASFLAAKYDIVKSR